MRRVLCISLYEVHIEIVRAKEKLLEGAALDPSRESALAVVVARPHGTIKSERDILGGTTLDVVSVQARALGVRAGQTVAAARAKCSNLQIRVIAQESVRSSLVRVAEAALAFGPTASFCESQDVVWVEIGGCAHLRGGERKLAEALAHRVRALGHACRVAIAGGPRIAAAVARFALQKKIEAHAVFIVPKDGDAAAMRGLPVTALGLDGDTVAWLDSLGLHVCGDLQKLPRKSLAMRLGKRARDVLQLLFGEDDSPLDAWRPPEVPEERIELDWGATSIESLAFIMKVLCDRLAVRLEGRAMATVRIEIVLAMDRDFYERAGKAMPPVTTLDVALPSPIARAADLLTIVRARLDREILPAPVLAVTLRASELTHATAQPLDMFVPEAKANRALPGLISELIAELGERSLGTLALGDSWITSERTQLHPFGAPHKTSLHPLVTSAMEPSRLVARVRVPKTRLVEIELLTRIEAAQWWRLGFARRDHCAAWIPTHHDANATEESHDAHHDELGPRVAFGRDGALAWVELTEGDDADVAQVRGWFD